MIYDYCTCGHPHPVRSGLTGRCGGYDVIGEPCGCKKFVLVEEEHHRERAASGLPVRSSWQM